MGPRFRRRKKPIQLDFGGTSLFLATLPFNGYHREADKLSTVRGKKQRS